MTSYEHISSVIDNEAVTDTDILFMSQNSPCTSQKNESPILVQLDTIKNKINNADLEVLIASNNKQNRFFEDALIAKERFNTTNDLKTVNTSTSAPSKSIYIPYASPSTSKQDAPKSGTLFSKPFFDTLPVLNNQCSISYESKIDLIDKNIERANRLEITKKKPSRNITNNDEGFIEFSKMDHETWRLLDKYQNPVYDEDEKNRIIARNLNNIEDEFSCAISVSELLGGKDDIENQNESHLSKADSEMNDEKSPIELNLQMLSQHYAKNTVMNDLNDSLKMVDELQILLDDASNESDIGSTEKEEMFEDGKDRGKITIKNIIFTKNLYKYLFR